MNRPFSVEQADARLAGTGMDPETFEPTVPAPEPCDPDTLELFGDEPTPEPESIPSPDEGAECAPGRSDCAGGDTWDGDPSRTVLGQGAV